jgi:hypothetical protein
MRPHHALVLLSATALAALQSAAAAETSTARFLVSVRGTVTKQWSYTTSRSSAGCGTRVTGNGMRTITLRSREGSVVTVRWSGGRSRVTFSGSAGSLAGLIRQTGTKVTQSSGPTGCEQGTRRASCDPITRTFKGQRAQLASGRAHKLGFRRMKGFVPDVFFNDCPGEPAAVRSLAAGLNLADGSFSERSLFDRSIGGLTLQGTAEATTTLLDRSATIVQRIRWTLTLRRLGG